MNGSDSVAPASPPAIWRGAGMTRVVHDGIEYGIMAACAEGLNILRHSNADNEDIAADAETTPLRNPEYYQYDFDLAESPEVGLIVAAEPILRKAKVSARLVSMPSWRLFEEQPAEYRESVLPGGVTARLAVEAASPLGWERWTGSRGVILGIDRFGASAPGEVMFREYGFTVDGVVRRALALMSGVSVPPDKRAGEPR